MNNTHVNMIHNNIDEERKKHTASLWNKVDLKSLMLLFAQANPPISQAQVASSLNLSKVTMSRWVTGFNKKDNCIKEEWIPVLESLLDKVDAAEISSIIETLNILQEIKVLRNEKNDEDIYPSVCIALRNYFAKRESQYTYDSSYRGKPYMLRFYRDDEHGHRKWWYFNIVSSNVNSKQHIDSGPFAFFKHMPSILSSDRISTIYSDNDLFSEVWYKSIKGKDMNSLKKVQQFQSLFLYDPNTESIVEERIISLPVSEYNCYL